MKQLPVALTVWFIQYKTTIGRSGKSRREHSFIDAANELINAFFFLVCYSKVL